MPGKDAYCCVFMENLALHQRSLLLMVDVWRPACTWHRLHRTLFWVLIRQACSENHLTAHHDCSQMLQKMASPLRLTATAVILSNVKQEATLSDAKNVYEVLGVYKKSGSKEFFEWGKKWKVIFVCLREPLRGVSHHYKHKYDGDVFVCCRRAHTAEAVQHC